MLPGYCPGPVQLFSQTFIKNLIYKRTFTGAGYTSHAGQHAQRKLHINIFQVVLFRSPYRQPTARLLSFLRNRDPQSPAQIGTCNRIGIVHQIFCCANAHQFSAMLPGTWADIHNTVRCTHGVLIVFHHDQGITQITQMTERIQQFIIISLVQTDTWFIQNIGNTHQTRTNLGSQTDTLSLSAGQSCCGTGKRQIIQSHIHQESDSCPDFLQDLTADHLLRLCQFQMFHKFCQHGNGHGGNLKNIFVTHSNSQCFRLQPLPLTDRTGSKLHKCLIFLPTGFRTGLTVSSLHITNQTFESHIIDTFPTLTFIMNLYRMSICSINKNIMNFLRIILERRGEIKIVFFTESIQYGSCKTSFRLTRLPARNGNSTFFNGKGRIRYHQALIKFHLITQPQTVRACTERVVKRKTPRLNLVHTDSAVRAGKTLTEIQVLAIHGIHHQQTVRQSQYTFD